MKLLLNPWFSVILFSLSMGCDPPATNVAVPVEHLPAVQAFKTPTEKPSLPEQKLTIRLSESTRYDDCHVILEAPEGSAIFPGTKADRLGFMLGCGMEAYEKLADGSFVTAHATPGDGVKNLRVTRWSDEGKRLWYFDADRSNEAKNFTANFRSAWVADLSPTHVCAGTMWEGGTDGTCVTLDDGKIIWAGRMSFWAGSKPLGFDGGLYVTDVSGLSQRYPFSGVEMKFRKFDGSGGRSALYLTGQDHLLFSPSRAEKPRLIRYDLKTLEASWRAELPANPTANYGLIEKGVAVIGVENAVLALDDATGALLWQASITEPRAPIAATNDAIYILERRVDLPNLLHCRDLKSGAPRWSAETPLGTLNVFAAEGRVFIRSVRTVQEVLGTQE
jgi:outer membrane protein assembly factor BamB